MKRHSLEMEDKKSTNRRSKATTLFTGSELVAGEESLHVGIDEQVQIKVDGAGRDADHQTFRYLSTARTSFHVAEDSGMIPQLRFNPGIVGRISRERKEGITVASSIRFSGLILCRNSKNIQFSLR